MNDIEQRLDELAHRVQRLEDELAIHRLIARYGMAVDIGDASQTAAVFQPDGVYDADVRLMNGRADIEEMVRSERHQQMVGHCAHQIGPAIVRVHGDTATAVGYSRVYLRTPVGTGVYRVSYNRWELRRSNQMWLVARRLTRVLGHDEARAVFEQGLREV